MPFEIKFIDFSKEDTGETLGMALDAQFENLVKQIIPPEKLAGAPQIVQDLMPAIAAWALRRYAKLNTGVIGDMLKGIMKKNIAEVVSARWLKF